MIGVQPNTIYLGRNSDTNGVLFRFLPFKPTPLKTGNHRNSFAALVNSTLNVTEQIGTPYQISFIISLFGAIVPGSIYNNSNANLTYDITLNLGGTITFSVTDINGTTSITTTQSLEVGWSYEVTCQYNYSGQFIPLTELPKSGFMDVFLNGIRAAISIDFDSDASITSTSPTLSASTLAVNSSATSAVGAVSQWYSKVGSSAFAFQWWYYWWYAWWRSSWWSYYYYYYWWYWWVSCNLGPCDPANCGPNACHPAAPFDTLYQFDRIVGDVDFVLGGAGIRDIDTNTTPAAITMTIPGTVLKAYLYWNTIGGGQQQVSCPDTAIINSNPVTGDIIGCTGNTCWSAFCLYSGQAVDPGQEDQQILNKVWFADVTSFVTGSGTYNIEIPNVIPGEFIAYNASDSPYYPGCVGGQGVALLVIYQTEPNVVTRPRQHCCVDVPGQTVTERMTREIIIWHGARLLSCPTPGEGPCYPETIGGDYTYTISWPSKYTWEPKIATAVGDAQSQLADSFYWNGTPLPPSPSYFNPYVGNLMHVKTEYLPAHSAVCACNGEMQNSVTAVTPDDCLCWFLFVWSGGLKCVTPVISQSQSFTSPPTPAMSLWNPNPPECCPVKLPCCGDVCLPAKLNLSVVVAASGCSCLTTQVFKMNWNKTEQKYLLEPTVICGCTFFGWLYCDGTEWTLYLTLASGATTCSDGINTNFPITCTPFGGSGDVTMNSVNPCGCDCVSGILTVNVSPG